MIEKPYKVNYKCILTLYPSDEITSRPFFLDILDTLRDSILDVYSLPISLSSMSQYGKHTSEDGKTRAFIASVSPDQPSHYPFLWSIKIQSQDNDNRRRQWTTHIGLKLTSDTDVCLHFLETYTDHLGGYLQSVPYPLRRTPAIIRNLLCSKRVLCTSGSYCLQPDPMELTDETMQYFMGILNDELRTVPIIVNTSPYIIDPAGLHNRIAGNAFQFFVMDPGIVIQLSDTMPQDMRVDFDSLRVFMPNIGNAPPFHPMYRVGDLQCLSPKQIVAAIAQAFSENMRGSELREFVSIDYIYRLRSDNNHTKIQREYEQSKSLIDKLSHENLSLSHEVDKLRSTVLTYSAQSLDEYEELLQESMVTLDKYNAAISSLSDELYSKIGAGSDITISRPSTNTPVDGLMYALIALTKSISASQ